MCFMPLAESPCGVNAPARRPEGGDVLEESHLPASYISTPFISGDDCALLPQLITPFDRSANFVDTQHFSWGLAFLAANTSLPLQPQCLATIEDINICFLRKKLWDKEKLTEAEPRCESSGPSALATQGLPVSSTVNYPPQLDFLSLWGQSFPSFFFFPFLFLFLYTGQSK